MWLSAKAHLCVMPTYLQDQHVVKINYSATPFTAVECDGCAFTNCLFAGVDLSNLRFVDCRFTDCDFSNARLLKTTFTDVSFHGCKLLGLRFDHCTEAPFAVAFDACTLNFSSFYRRPLKNTEFKNCVLHEVDFTEANLTSASFAGSDLQRALFDNTVLEKADFRTAVNFSIDPEKNRVKKARFSREGLAGLLEKYNLHID